ncbi:MAG: HU family DNA-binding protein [Acidobacteriota bacterium]|nr:HU family DNA-binding protein [Acidobacteriota bacterium]MDH3522164.1 HU family DNA-binding protein [Acidobacteriota bacterium]
MNKKELAEKLAKNCDLSKAKAQEVIAELFDTKPRHGIIATELDAGREVQILGFGNFGTKRRAARSGRNPATGATITIAAKKYPFFKAGKGLKDRVSD